MFWIWMGQEIQFDDVQGRNKGASRLIKNSIGVNLFGKYKFFRLYSKNDLSLVQNGFFTI